MKCVVFSVNAIAGSIGERMIRRLQSHAIYSRVEFHFEYDIRTMNINIKVNSKSYLDILIAIRAAIDSNMAECLEIELDSDEYHELMKDLYVSSPEAAMRGVISGNGAFMGIPIKLK